MGYYTLFFMDCAPASSDAPRKDTDGWRMAVAGYPYTEWLDGMQVSVNYPFNTSIDNNFQLYLEDLPTSMPWEVRQGVKSQKQIYQYATAIFNQLNVLHELAISPNIDHIIIDVSERNTRPGSSNIFRLYWEVLENPKVWDELWEMMYSTEPLKRRPPIPKIVVRRTIPSQTHVGVGSSLGWIGDEDWSEDDDDLNHQVGRLVLSTSFERWLQSGERRSILSSRGVNKSVLGRWITQNLHVELKFFRILLVIARNIKTERASAKRKCKPRDPDPSLISEPLLEAIAQLSGSIDVRLEICRPGSWSALKNLLRDKENGYYDLVHFDMHGEIDESKGAGLRFLSEAAPKTKGFGTTEFVAAHEVGQLLREAGVLMVALNACRSGREGPIDAVNQSTSQSPQPAGGLAPAPGIHINLARAFVECDIPSVIAMSYKVTGSFVSIFYKSFYNALLRSRSIVAEAVATARQALISQKDRTLAFGVKVELEDWIIPVLYESHTLTIDMASVAESGTARPNMAEGHPTEIISAGRRLLRNIFHPGSLTVKDILPRHATSTTPPSTGKMYGRGLEILFVEAQILHSTSHRTLFVSGRSGIGRTHFVKGLGYSWVLTGCISHAPTYISCLKHWKAPDMLRAIVQEVTDKPLSLESIDQAKKSLRNSRRLIIVDDVEPENLLEAGDLAAEPSLQEFIQGLSGGQSVLIIVCRKDPRSTPRLLRKETKGCVRFFPLSERTGVAVQEVTLDILRDLRVPVELNSPSEKGDLRRITECLDNNPQLIRMFLKVMSEAGLLSSMMRGLHHLLYRAVRLPVEDAESRLVRIAHDTFANMDKLKNGHELRKLLLCLAPFNNFIPCGFHDELFFPSAACYFGYLRQCQVLEWPSSADPGVLKQGDELSKDPSLMYFQLSHLAEESKELFYILIKQLLDSGLVDFAPQTAEITEMSDAVEEHHNRVEDGTTRATQKLLAKLAYLRINPILTHYLRSQFGKATGETTHGLKYPLLLMAYCSYYKLFSASRWNEHDSQQPNRTGSDIGTTNRGENRFTSDSVYLHDTPNIYSVVQIALEMSHPTARWMLLPSFALIELGNMAAHTFRPHVWPYEPLPTGAFTEETILIMLHKVLSYWDSAPRAERDSPTPLKIAAALSFTHCVAALMIGQSQFSDFGIDRRLLSTSIKRAMVTHRRLREIYGTPRQPPTFQERFLQAMLEDTAPEPSGLDDTRLRRIIGEERWLEIEQSRRDNDRVEQLVNAAIRGGLPDSPFVR